MRYFIYWVAKYNDEQHGFKSFDKKEDLEKYINEGLPDKPEDIDFTVVYGERVGVVPVKVATKYEVQR